MEENNLNDIIYSPTILEFVTVANEYCTFIENNSTLKRQEFLSKTQKLTSLLYLKMVLLPEVTLEVEEDDESEKFVTEEDYNYYFHRIQVLLAQFDTYQEVFNSDMIYSDGALDQSISENLMDIYQDVKNFVLNYRIGNVDTMKLALYESQENFKNYWGQGLVNVLRAIHNLLYGEQDISEDNDKPSLSDKKENDQDPNWILSQQFKNFREED